MCVDRLVHMSGNGDGKNLAGSGAPEGAGRAAAATLPSHIVSSAVAAAAVVFLAADAAAVAVVDVVAVAVAAVGASTLAAGVGDAGGVGGCVFVATAAVSCKTVGGESDC